MSIDERSIRCVGTDRPVAHKSRGFHCQGTSQAHSAGAPSSRCSPKRSHCSPRSGRSAFDKEARPRLPTPSERACRTPSQAAGPRTRLPVLLIATAPAPKRPLAHTQELRRFRLPELRGFVAHEGQGRRRTRSLRDARTAQEGQHCRHLMGTRNRVRTCVRRRRRRPAIARPRRRSTHEASTYRRCTRRVGPRRRLTASPRPKGADVGSVYQRAGSHVSDRVGTLPKIGTPHPVPRSGCTAKFPGGVAVAGFPTYSEPIVVAGSIGVGGSGTALRIETLGEPWLSTGAMVPRSRSREATTRCAGRA